MAHAGQPSQPPRSSASALFQAMLANAVLLSLMYLGIGLVVEVLLRVYPSNGVVTTSLVIDSLPARVLDGLGLLPRLTEAYAYDHLSGFWLRAIFAATTVAIIFALAVVVGLATTLTGMLITRRRAGR